MLVMEPAVKKLIRAFASLNSEWCIRMKSLPGTRHMCEENVNGIVIAVTTTVLHVRATEAQGAYL